MNATFRLRRSYRNEGLGFLPFFLAWFGLIVYLSGNESAFGSRIWMLVFMGIVPLFMAGLAVWSVLAYWRVKLTILDNLVTYRGVLCEKTIDLRDLIHARWLFARNDGFVKLKTRSVRLAIDLLAFEFENHDREQIVEHLRSVLTPEIQVGWNLYADKMERSSRIKNKKPGPDEILVKRDRYDRYLWPSLAVATPMGIFTWWVTANPGYLALPLGPIFNWALFRCLTPAEGTIETKLSIPRNPETIRIIGFVVTWFLLAFVGLAVYEYFRPGMKEPDPILIVGAVVWLGVLFFEGYRLDRRWNLREQETADLAAKGQAETAVDHWDVE
jgi:hypothetical protein